MSEYHLRTSSQIEYTSVPASTTPVTLLESNIHRAGASIVNVSTSTLYVLVGAGTPNNSTSHTVQLGENMYWEVPYGYTGLVQGVWATADGNANVTEYE